MTFTYADNMYYNYLIFNNIDISILISVLLQYNFRCLNNEDFNLFFKPLLFNIKKSLNFLRGSKFQNTSI